MYGEDIPGKDSGGLEYIQLDVSSTLHKSTSLKDSPRSRQRNSLLDVSSSVETMADYPGSDSLLATDENSLNNNDCSGYSDHGESRTVMPIEATEKQCDKDAGPNPSSSSSHIYDSQRKKSDQNGATCKPNSEEMASVVERHVRRNGKFTKDGQRPRADPSFPLPANPNLVPPSSLQGKEGIEQPSAMTGNDTKSDSVASPTTVPSPNGALSNAVLKSAGGTGDHDDNECDGRVQSLDSRSVVSKRLEETEETKDEAGGGGDDDKTRALRYRLMGSILGSCLLVITAYMSQVAMLSQYLFRRTAIEHFNLTNVTLKQTPCADNVNSSRLQDDLNWLQATTSQQLFYYSVVQFTPPIFIALFVGSYADYLGRKFLVLGPIIGGFLKSVVIFLVVYLDLNLNYLYLAHALDGLTGSVYILILGIFAAIADVTFSSHQRVMLFALIEISLALAGALSQIGTGFLIEATGFVVLNLVICCLFFLGCLSVLIFMPETLRSRPEHLVLNPCVHLRKVFGFYFWDGPLRKRALFLMGQLILFITTMINMGRMPVETLFEMNSPLCWGSIKIGFFMGIRVLVQNLAGVTTLKVLSRHVPIELIGILGLMSGIASFVVESQARSDLMMYISGAVGVWMSVVAPIGRTLMSRMVSADSQGALFASLAAVETLCSLTASIVYNNVYSATLDVFPGAVFLLMASLLLVNLVMLIIFTLVSRKYPHFQEIQIDVKKPGSSASTSRRSSSTQILNDEITPLLSESSSHRCLEASLPHKRNGVKSNSPRRTKSFVY